LDHEVGEARKPRGRPRVKGFDISLEFLKGWDVITEGGRFSNTFRRDGPRLEGDPELVSNISRDVAVSDKGLPVVCLLRLRTQSASRWSMSFCSGSLENHFAKKDVISLEMDSPSVSTIPLLRMDSMVKAGVPPIIFLSRPPIRPASASS